MFLQNFFSPRAVPIPSSFLGAWSTIAGILCATSTLGTVLLIPLLIVLSYLLTGWTTKKKMCLAWLFFILGWYRFNHYHRTFIESTHELEGKPISGKAQVVELACTPEKYHAHCLTLKITSLHHKKAPSQNTIRLYLRTKPPLINGDTIYFHRLNIPKQTSKTFQQYLFKEGIVTSGYPHKFSFRLCMRPIWHISQWCSDTLKRTSKAVSQKLTSQTNALFHTLFLGEKARNSRSSLYAPFMRWGIIHFLARSGLHIMILAGTWSALLMRLSFSWRLRRLTVLLMMGTYYALSWPSISFLRACVGWICYQGFISVGTAPRTLHILSLTTLLIILWNPFQLFYLDFQLSFGLTCALGWWQEAFYHQKRLKS